MFVLCKLEKHHFFFGVSPYIILNDIIVLVLTACVNIIHSVEKEKTYTNKPGLSL